MIESTFVMTSTVILLTPGPTNTLLAASGTVMGVRRAVVLPLAESLGYALAVSAFAGLAGALSGTPWAMPMLKAVAAAWLLFSAGKLWSARVATRLDPVARPYWRVLITTLLNPKAMLVGTLMIPQLPPVHMIAWIAGFVVMAYFAGLGWVVFGASLPKGFRPHAYKAAALVLGLFSLIAMGSAIISV